MKSYEEEWYAAAPEPAFSNGSEGEIWMARWCERCVHDLTPAGCDLVAIAMQDRTPTQWVPADDPRDTYECTEWSGP